MEREFHPHTHLDPSSENMKKKKKENNFNRTHTLHV